MGTSVKTLLYHYSHVRNGIQGNTLAEYAASILLRLGFNDLGLRKLRKIQKQVKKELPETSGSLAFTKER